MVKRERSLVRYPGGQPDKQQKIKSESQYSLVKKLRDNNPVQIGLILDDIKGLYRISRSKTFDRLLETLIKGVKNKRGERKAKQAELTEIALNSRRRTVNNDELDSSQQQAYSEFKQLLLQMENAQLITGVSKVFQKAKQIFNFKNLKKIFFCQAKIKEIRKNLKKFNNEKGMLQLQKTELMKGKIKYLTKIQKKGKNIIKKTLYLETWRTTNELSCMVVYAHQIRAWAQILILLMHLLQKQDKKRGKMTAEKLYEEMDSEQVQQRSSSFQKDQRQKSYNSRIKPSQSRIIPKNNNNEQKDLLQNLILQNPEMQNKELLSIMMNQLSCDKNEQEQVIKFFQKNLIKNGEKDSLLNQMEQQCQVGSTDSQALPILAQKPFSSDIYRPKTKWFQAIL